MIDKHAGGKVESHSLKSQASSVYCKIPVESMTRVLPAIAEMQSTIAGVVHRSFEKTTIAVSFQFFLSRRRAGRV